MLFRICKKEEQILYLRDVVRLEIDNWDDSGFKTSFDATYYDSLSRAYHLGCVQIGKKGMSKGKIVDFLPVQFEKLSEEFFSLGQDESYYETIKKLGDGTRQILLAALCDLAFQPDMLNDIENEEVLRISLLRGIASDPKTALNKVRGQFSRMAHGGARLTKYHFVYTAPGEQNPLELDFRVDPESKLPTNVHAIIGRNGCGKTYLIRNMVQCLQHPNNIKYGGFTYLDDEEGMGKFVNVLCIAFSPFDDFAELIKSDGEIPATYVGLNKKDGNLLKTVEDKFLLHFQNCIYSQRKRNLWMNAIRTLTSDPTFRREGILNFLDDINFDKSFKLPDEKENEIRTVFGKLSSGHKVVLLIITSCVAEIEEQSILFLDEPENHLHPPLLSALVRALSDLLKEQNGVAIVSTHSPVVLQEVPKSCVWRMSRLGQECKAERLKKQTFGTNVATLTNEVFRLEADQPGFYQLLKAAVDQEEDLDTAFDLIFEAFGRQLGDEARMMLWTLLSIRKEAQQK